MKAIELFLSYILEETRRGNVTWQIDESNDNPNIIAKHTATYEGAKLLIGKSIIAQAPYYFSVTFPGNISGNLFSSEMENPFKLKALYDCAEQPSNDACLNFMTQHASSSEKGTTI